MRRGGGSKGEGIGFLCLCCYYVIMLDGGSFDRPFLSFAAVFCALVGSQAHFFRPFFLAMSSLLSVFSRLAIIVVYLKTDFRRHPTSLYSITAPSFSVAAARSSPLSAFVYSRSRLVSSLFEHHRRYFEYRRLQYVKKYY